MRIQAQYRRLSSAEREELSRGLAQGETLSATARHLGRTPSTLFREVERNSGTSGYRAFSAGIRAASSARSRRFGKRRIRQEPRLRSYAAKINQSTVFQFAKHLRNGAAHNNKFLFSPPLQEAVQWRGKVIDNSLRGRTVFADFINPIDLVSLMADISILLK